MIADMSAGQPSVAMGGFEGANRSWDSMEQPRLLRFQAQLTNLLVKKKNPQDLYSAPTSERQHGIYSG